MNPESDETAAAIAALVWWRRFASSARSVAVARRAAARVLSEWCIEDAGVSDVALVVSELVTNAVRHGQVPGRLVELRLEYDLEKSVLVEVSDAGDGRPPSTGVRQIGGPLAESGRGLTLVAAFADSWGVREREIGKTVWARLLVGPGRSQSA
jgi:anti-sigma regulatory factor (Ser/Thr protein kinase)